MFLTILQLHPTNESRKEVRKEYSDVSYMETYWKINNPMDYWDVQGCIFAEMSGHRICCMVFLFFHLTYLCVHHKTLLLPVDDDFDPKNSNLLSMF